MYYGFAVKAITAIGTSELSEQVNIVSAKKPDSPLLLSVVSQDEL